MANKNKSEVRKKILELYEENELANLESNKNRARSITVGTAFGGVTEISMRGDYASLWTILQPVEVVELIEQLSAGIGLEIAMRPRQDFASWRGWNVDADVRYWAGSGHWQIEQATESRKKFLEEPKDDESSSKVLPPSKKVKSSNRKKSIKESKDLARKKVAKELEIQKKVSNDLGTSALENLEDLRKDLRDERKEFVDMMNPEDD